MSFLKVNQYDTQSSQESCKNLLRINTDHQWIKEIKTALLDHRFCLYIQEINALATLDTQQYYDVLLFLMTEAGQKIPAEVFQPIAQRYGLSRELNSWMINHFLEAITQLPAPCLEHYRFSLPLSHSHLKDFNWLKQIDSSLNHLGIRKNIISFELSEAIALLNLNLTSDLVATLQTLGYYFTLDNCGDQMVSFSYLKHLPVNYLKISEKFVRTLHQDITDRAIVEFIHYLAKVMGLQTIAKGVDSQEILKEVIDLSIDYAQGLYLAEPQPLNLQRLQS